MGFRKGSYAKVWKWEKGNGNYVVAEMSTSKKLRENGQDVIKDGKAVYQTDWSNKFVRLVGTAAKQIETIGDRVRIGDCEVTNNYDKEKKVLYTNYVIYSFEEDEEEREQPKKSSAKKANNTKDDSGFMDVPEGNEDDLPFN